MDIFRFRTILETLIAGHINEVVFLVGENETPILKGLAKDTSLAVFSIFPAGLLPASLGLHRIKALLDRLSLFQLSQTMINPHIEGNRLEGLYIQSLIFEEGHKHSVYMASKPETIRARTMKLNGADVITEIPLSLTHVQRMLAAMAAMPASSDQHLITFMQTPNGVSYRLQDQTKDVYQETLEGVRTESTSTWSYAYPRDAVNRLMHFKLKSSAENAKSSTRGEVIHLGCTSKGFLKMTLCEIDFYLLPKITSEF